MKFGVVLFSRMSVPNFAEFSRKQASQGDHEKSGGCEFPISGGCEFQGQIKGVLGPNAQAKGGRPQDPLTTPLGTIEKVAFR